MSPKIMIVGQLPPPHHGANVMTKTFYSSLQKLGYKVSIVEKKFSKTMEEVETFSLKKYLRAISVFFTVTQNFITKKSDLCFYFISIKPPTFYIDALFITLLKLIGTNVVLYIHGKGFRKYSKNYFLMRWLLKSHIFCKSLGALVLGERLKNDATFFISNDRIFVLPNCIPDLSDKIFSTFRKKKNSGKIQILYLSNLHIKKGPIEFIKMARRVLDKSRSAKFIMAGPILSLSFQRQIERLIHHLKLIDDIEIVGAVYGLEKERLFLSSDIFVFPSQNDAFPLVNLEAMRAGTPIVSSNVGSIPEMVVDELNGYIVDSKNVEQLSERVLKLVNDDELRTEMGKAGRKMYEDFFTTRAYEKRLNDGVKFFFKTFRLRSHEYWI